MNNIIDSPSSSCLSSPDFTLCCEVCNQMAHGNHFGAITCRACAAFFRRMNIVENRILVCKNNNTCKPTTNGRWVCKKCRLDRCEYLGMKTDNIQLNRDSFFGSARVIKRLKTHKRLMIDERIPITVERCLGAPHMIIIMRREWDESREVSYIDLTRLVENASEILKSSNIDCNSLPISLNSLEKLAVGLREVRKTQKKDVDKLNLFGKNETCRIWEHQFIEATRFVMYFDEFRILPFETKFKVLKCMWHLWAKLERVAMTAEMRVNRQCGKKQFVVSHDLLIDYENLEVDVGWHSPYSPEELSFFVDPASYYGDPLVNSFIELQPDNVELTYIICDLCFRLTEKKLGQEYTEIIEKLRDTLANDIHNYYSITQNQPRYSHRLAKLLQINNDYQKQMQKRQEKIALASFLGAFHVEFSHPELFQYSC